MSGKSDRRHDRQNVGVEVERAIEGGYFDEVVDALCLRLTGYPARESCLDSCCVAQQELRDPALVERIRALTGKVPSTGQVESIAFKAWLSLYERFGR